MGLGGAVWPEFSSLNSVEEWSLAIDFNWASQVALVVKKKNPPANAGDITDNRREIDPWVGKISWRRAQQPTPVFFPGES